MPRLRDLLDIASADSFTIDKGAPTFFENANQSLVFVRSCTDSPNYNYDEGCFCCWQIQSSMNNISFEVWGGGGGGAGSCCCSWGAPGGAGAYAKKSLDNTTGTYNGQCYTFCISAGGCCSPVQSCGYRGCQSHVIGAGLTNFCAEGGIPGCGLCFFFGCFPNSGCGILWHPSKGTQCACYFGADEGVPGHLGGMEASCCDAGNWCHYKSIHPVPAMPGRPSNAYQAIGAHCNLVASCDRCRMNGWGVSGAMGSSEMVAIGIGGTTARTCGGGCCCGMGGGPGMLKISWS